MSNFAAVLDAEGFKKPAMTNEEYISVLERQSLPETAAALRELFSAE